ncbi:hypothetical protein DPMN_125428 [Dreissena polymorpha]|uniref:Uncharacterized protein n=1 Tax=Dreissena polymorpha TaxID=45954 RepID=A0A9D4GXH6_DREPO|nr:hypothetical protein DPMN_125428 [Dreissena polymorpha]
MKIEVCFFALTIAYACAASCTQTSDCDPVVTSCGGNTVLHCHDFLCVCESVTGEDAHKCVSNGDCHDHHHDGDLHNCQHGQHWECMQGYCHCTGGHGK